MTITSDKTGSVPMVIPADYVPGPGQGNWTYKEYAAMPDDGNRYEIIDGVLYMAPSPNERHQTIAGEIFFHLCIHVKLTNIGRVYMGPLDVQLASGTVVQPDVFVVLKTKREIITFSRIIGAPDLVVEVASPGTSTLDRSKKQLAYAGAGVPEYWIVDPAARTVEVLSLQGKEYRSLGVFEGPATLPTQVLPEFPVRVEQFFAYVL